MELTIRCLRHHNGIRRSGCQRQPDLSLLSYAFHSRSVWLDPVVKVDTQLRQNPVPVPVTAGPFLCDVQSLPDKGV